MFAIVRFDHWADIIASMRRLLLIL